MQQAGALDTNLLATAKRQKAEPAPEKKKETVARRIFKIFAYFYFFLLSLSVFTCLKIPDSVIANSLLNFLNKNTAYQWQAEKIAIAFFPTPHLAAQKINLEPKLRGAGLPLLLDEIRIHPNPIAFLPFNGSPAFGASFRAEAYKTTIRGYIANSSNTEIQLETDGLDLSKVTPLAQGGQNIKGIISSLVLQLTLPGQRMSAADGEIKATGKNVTFDPAMLQLGLALPILDVGPVEIQGTAAHGQVKVEKFNVGAPGRDIELKIASGTVTLSDVMQNTRYDLHVLLKPSANIEKAIPGFGALIGSMASKHADGFYAMRLTGTLAAPAFPQKDP